MPRKQVSARLLRIFPLSFISLLCHVHARNAANTGLMRTTREIRRLGRLFCGNSATIPLIPLFDEVSMPMLRIKNQKSSLKLTPMVTEWLEWLICNFFFNFSCISYFPYRVKHQVELYHFSVILWMTAKTDFSYLIELIAWRMIAWCFHGWPRWNVKLIK